MKTPLYKQYANAKPIATLLLSNFGGILILEIQEDYFNDGYVITCFDWGNGRKNIRKHKIEYTAPAGCNERMYFRIYNKRYYLDEFLRMEV